MPGFDRTGPRGEGPLTGGGRGVCLSETDLRYANSPGVLPVRPRFSWLRFPRLGLRSGLRGSGRGGRGMQGGGRGRCRW